MLCLNKENIAHSSFSIWFTSHRNEIKKVFWMFIFENLIKETEFSVTTTMLTLGLILGRFFLSFYFFIFFDVPRIAPVNAKQALYWMGSIFEWK